MGPRINLYSVAAALLLWLSFSALGQGDYSYDASGNLVQRFSAIGAFPQILAQPQPQIVVPGELASFSVLLANSSGVGYKWLFNGTNLAGQTSDALLLFNVTTNNQGPYSVVITNSSGSVTSTVAQLYIDSRGCGMPDVWQMAYFGNLNQNPAGDFDGDGVPNLQEYLDGTNPTNSTSFRSRLNLVSSSGGAVAVAPELLSYAPTDTVTLTGTPFPPNSLFGWTGDLVTRSNPAALAMNTNKTVRACFTCFPPIAGLIGWWRGETDGSDFIGGHTGTFYSGTNILAPSITATGVVGSAFVLYGTNYLRVADAPELKPPQLTLEAWVFPFVQNGNYQSVIARGSAGNDDDGHYLGVISGVASFWTKNNGTMSQVAGGSVPANQWTHLAATFDGSTKRLYVNGVLVGTQGGLGPLTYDAGSIPLTIGSDWVVNAPAYLFNGWLDEVALFNRALDPAEITGLYLANCAGKCTTHPVFVSGPQLATATQSVAYAQQIITVLGTQPVSFSLSAGSLPAGLGLSASGQVSGVPATAGSNVFAVLATDAAGLSTELICGLQVMPAPPPQVPATPAGVVSWWRAENNALDSVGTNHGTLSNGLAFATGEVGQAFWFNGTNQEVRIPASPSLDVGTGSGFTLEAWIKPADLVTQFPLIEWNDGVTSGAHFWLNVAFSGLGGPGCFYANLRDINSTDHYVFSPTGMLSTSVWQHVALTYDRTSGTAKLFYNGAVAATVNAGIFVPRTTANLHLGYRPGYLSYAGLLDEPTVYNRVLSATEIASVYFAGPLGKTLGPYINTPPTLPDGVVGLGYTQSIVSVRGSAPMTYALAGGALPPGLNLNSAGQLTGIPTTTGAFNFTALATDSASLSNSQSFSLQVYAPVPVPPGMMGWWRAENNSLDSAGTNNGVLRNGAGFGAGKVGRAFALDGSSQSVDIADAPALRPASLTLETWILLNYVPGPAHIFAKPLGSGTLDSYGIYINGGVVNGFVCDTNGFGPTLSAAFSPVPGTWHHVAYTFDDPGKQQALYLDGAKVAAGFANKTINYDSQPLLLGRDIENGAPNYFFPGRIDEAAIYNRALDAAEIAALYTAGTGGKTSAGPYFTNAPPLPDAVLNAAYNQTLGTARGSGQVTFSVVSGPLPPGLFLNAAGLLSGTPSAPGAFSFTIRATDSAALSADQAFTLRVSAQPPPPAGIVAWWRAENNGLDSIGTNNAVLINATTFAPGKVGQAFSLSGNNDALKILDAPALHPASFTLETWVLFYSVGGLQVMFAKPLGGGVLDSFALSLNNGNLDGTIADYSGLAPDVTTPFAPAPGQWYHVAYTFDDASKVQTLYLNGSAVTNSVVNKSIAYDSQSVELGRDIENGAPNFFLAGRLDEAAIYNRALSATEIAAIYNAGSVGKANAGPYITTAPVLPPGAVGQAYTQSFAAVRGTSPISYSISAGTLPPGLSLSSAGVLSGVPTAAGAFTFTVRATDGAALTGEQICTLGVTGQVPPPSGLISWWRAEGDATDALGTNNGVLRNGVAFAAGVSGQAFVLDGIDTSVDVPDSPSLRPASITLESWVMFNATGTHIVMGKPVGSSFSDSYQIYLSGGALGGFIGDAAGPGSQLTIPFAPVLGQWYHVAYTFDDLTRQQVLYLNGLDVASGLGSKAIGYDSQPVELGRDTENGAPAFFLQGRLDEAAIYGRALAAPEVFSLYQAGPAGKTTIGPYFGTSPALPDAILSRAYAQTLSAVRGTAPIAYSLTAGGLPPGLTLNTNGSLAGVPVSAGRYSFTVRATDSAALFAEQTFSLQVYAPVLAPSGLAWWWRAENNALDSAGTNNGVLFNTTFAPGKVGTAFNLNGTNAYVAIPNSSWLNPTGAFSVEFWMKPSPQQFSSDGYWLVVDKSHGFADGTGWVLEGNPDGTFSIAFGKGGSGSPANFVSATTPGSVRDDHWHHVAGVFTGTQLTLFLDGTLQSTLNVTNVPAGNARDIEIGRSWGGGSPLRSFHGLVDEVSYYSRGLSASEINGIYSAGPAGKVSQLIPPIILSAALQNSALVLSFASAPGAIYTVEYVDALNSGAWTTLATIPTTSTTTFFTNSISSPAQRFFRVRTTNN